MKQTKLATLAALCVAGVANAGFVIVDNGGAGLSTISPIPTNNDFRDDLRLAQGATTFAGTNFTLGGSLSVTPGPLGAAAYLIDVAVFASEAGFNNSFGTGSGLGAPRMFTSPGNLAWSQRNVGTLPGGNGILDFQFCAVSISSCLTNAANANTVSGSFQSIGMWVSADGNTAWLLWDDSGAATDDNHDDLIVRLTYRVPEPAALGLLGLGLLGVGAIRRKRSA